MTFWLVYLGPTLAAVINRYVTHADCCRWPATTETRQHRTRSAVSHPFVERLIGTIRREYLDRVFFWSAAARSVPIPLTWITTVGGSIAGACSNSRSLPDYEFATDTLLQ